MPKIDLTDYEKRLSLYHEQLCRTATMESGLWGFCALRKCRRSRDCTGPMVATPHQVAKIRAQRETGLSGDSCARLPLCAAHASAAHIQQLETSMDGIEKCLTVKDISLPSLRWRIRAVVKFKRQEVRKMRQSTQKHRHP